MFADRHPYAGGPDHYAAFLEGQDLQLSGLPEALHLVLGQPG